MHVLFFEVRPLPGHLPHYFDHVARLKPELARHSGLVFLDRYTARDDPQMLLSHQLWLDEAAIVAWRNDPVHRVSQAAGRQVHFADYRIRVGERVRHWCADGRAEPAGAPSHPGGLHVIALYGTQPVEGSGFSSFESVNAPGRFISTAQVHGLAAAEAVLDKQIGRPGLDQTAAYRIHRDYGMNDRAQAPQ